MPSLGDFEGAWTLSRRIEAAAGGGRLAGRASFTPDAAGLRYEERGTLTLDGQGALEARQAHLWRADAARIAVLFHDGRPFHDFDPAALRPTARHPCGRDVYVVAYDFARWPRWRSVWTVTGPAKDYRMASDYAPCG